MFTYVNFRSFFKKHQQWGNRHNSLHFYYNLRWSASDDLNFHSFEVEITNKQKLHKTVRKVSFFVFNSPLIQFKSLVRNTTTKRLVRLIDQICCSPIFIKRANPYEDRRREEPWRRWWCVWTGDLWKRWEPTFVHILYTDLDLLRSIIRVSIFMYTFPSPRHRSWSIEKRTGGYFHMYQRVPLSILAPWKPASSLPISGVCVSVCVAFLPLIFIF